MAVPHKQQDGHMLLCHLMDRNPAVLDITFTQGMSFYELSPIFYAGNEVCYKSKLCYICMSSHVTVV